MLRAAFRLPGTPGVAVPDLPNDLAAGKRRRRHTEAAVPRRRPEFRVAWISPADRGTQDHEKRNTRHPTAVSKAARALPAKGCGGAVLPRPPPPAGAVDKLEPFASPSQLEAETSRVDRPQRVANPPAESESLFPSSISFQVCRVGQIIRSTSYSQSDAVGQVHSQLQTQASRMPNALARGTTWAGTGLSTNNSQSRPSRRPTARAALPEARPARRGGPTVVAAEWNPNRGGGQNPPPYGQMRRDVAIDRTKTRRRVGTHKTRSTSRAANSSRRLRCRWFHPPVPSQARSPAPAKWRPVAADGVARPPHHLPLGVCPARVTGEPEDALRFRPGGELLLLSPSAPQVRPIGQLQFGADRGASSAPPRQPLAERRYEIVVRQLIPPAECLQVLRRTLVPNSKTADRRA